MKEWYIFKGRSLMDHYANHSDPIICKCPGYKTDKLYYTKNEVYSIYGSDRTYIIMYQEDGVMAGVYAPDAMPGKAWEKSHKEFNDELEDLLK